MLWQIAIPLIIASLAIVSLWLHIDLDKTRKERRIERYYERVVDLGYHGANLAWATEQLVGLEPVEPIPNPNN